MIGNRESKHPTHYSSNKKNGGELKMVKVSIEVSNEATAFGVAVQAMSIERALSLVQ
jgi:hypothetical protein